MHNSLLLVSVLLFLATLLANFVRSRRLRISLMFSLMRPSQLILAYTYFFFAAGAAFFASQTLLRVDWYEISLAWNYWSVAILATASLVAIVVTNSCRLGPPESSFSAPSRNNDRPWHFVGLPFAMGAAVTGSMMLLLIATSFFFAGAANGGVKKKSFILLFLIAAALILPTASHGKRILLFPILIVLLLLLRDGFVRPKLFAIAFGASTLMIIPLSIMRGYGSYEVENFYEALLFSRAYVSSEIFWAALGNNTEAVSFYFNGIHSIHLAIESGDYLFGETILNALFLGSSLYGFDDGLRSSIEAYTQAFDPEFRAIGGSYPISIFSEIFMNFGVVSVVLFPVLLLCMDWLWRRISCLENGIVRFSLEASLLYCVVILTRGSSFDLFAYNLVILSLPSILLHLRLPRIRFRNSMHA